MERPEASKEDYFRFLEWILDHPPPSPEYWEEEAMEQRTKRLVEKEMSRIKMLRQMGNDSL